MRTTVRNEVIANPPLFSSHYLKAMHQSGRSEGEKYHGGCSSQREKIISISSQVHCVNHGCENRSQAGVKFTLMLTNYELFCSLDLT